MKGIKETAPMGANAKLTGMVKPSEALRKGRMKNPKGTYSGDVRRRGIVRYSH